MVAPARNHAIKPQPGPQEQFLSSSADFVIFGGAAGGGKTWALLLEPVRHKDNPRFGCTIFRRTFQQIDQEGGLWDESMQLYTLLGSRTNQQKHRHTFPSGARVGFTHLQHEKDVYNYQGGQIALLQIDEITHFNEREVFYLISRNRSSSGIKSYIRATCNPDPDSWVAQFIAWWIGPDGYAIPERSGVVRWFARDGETIHWADSKAELLEQNPQLHPEQPMSFTFILSRLKDNQELLSKDPQYKAKLMNLPKVERERLLGDEERGGNWKIREAAGLYFKREWFEIIDRAPADLKYNRGWDFAGTEVTKASPNPDWTRGVKVGHSKEGEYIITDMVSLRGSSAKVDKLFESTILGDGKACSHEIPQDPGEAGKKVAAMRVRQVPGHTVRARRVSGDKVTRAGPASSRAERGLIKVVRGRWNEAFFNELEQFPDGAHDDIVDALSEAINYPPSFVSYGVGAEAAG